MPAAPVSRTFVQYLFAFFSRLKAASDFISDRLMGQTVPDKCVEFRDLCLNRYGEIQPKAVRCGIFVHFSNFDKCRPEVAGDVIFSVACRRGCPCKIRRF